MGRQRASTQSAALVIERYRQHAFAHYFLAKAYERIGGNEQKVRDNLAAYEAIIAKNETWKSHADYFGLTGHPRFAAANANLAMSQPVELALVSA